MECVLVSLLCLVAVSNGFVDEVDEFAELKSQITQLQQTVNSMQTQLNATADLAAKAAAIPYHSPVAFTAHLTSTITNLGSHQQIVFDNVITNIGGAYSTRHGHFTAPVTGVYAFFLTVTNTPGHSASLTLMQNGHLKAVTLAHGTTTTPGQWETSTCAAVLMLNVTDEVWAQNEASFSAVEELDGHLYSSFGGFLINPL